MEALVVLALLACPVGMGLMMWFMARGMRGGHTEQHTQDSLLPELKAEQARLAEKIAALDNAAHLREPEENAEQPAPAEVR